MEKTFEDYFTEYQADIVSICLEYVDWHADVIYIYCSYENNMIYGDFFFKIHGKILERHKLNDVKSDGKGFEYDVSEERQKALLNIILENIKKIHALCAEYRKDMPTEMKLIYDVKKNRLAAKYSYENKWSDSETKLPEDIFDEWIEDVRNEQ